MILIGAPNPKSLSGVVTKYSPHWFHVWFYRHVRGDKNAGLPGQAPFPTYFHPLVTLAKLEAFAAGPRPADDLPQANMRARAIRRCARASRCFAALIDAAAAVMNVLLPGKTDVRHGDYHVILRKR